MIPTAPASGAALNILIRTQNPDGSWTEHETTGTGFPKVFYLKYDMYRNAWPLLALATYKKILKSAADRDSEINGHEHPAFRDAVERAKAPRDE